jgi:photosystem II stability/assembly factor-like uncharacterized protein
MMRGVTWSVQLLKMPDWASGGSFNGGASLAFADPMNGWLTLETGLLYQGGGLLLATHDGGKSWEPIPGRKFVKGAKSLAGPITMVTPQFGWLVAGQAKDGLYVTRDGAQTWQEVELESPVKTDQMREYDRISAERAHGLQLHMSSAEAKLASKWMKPQQAQTYPTYDLPIFKDPKQGYISVTYPGVVVLFATNDSGVTWKSDRVLTGLREHQYGSTVVSTVTDSTWITGRAAKNGMPELSKLGPGANTTDLTMPAPEESGISKMSFVTEKQGWVVTVYGRLLSTSDGGVTWTDITPARKARAPISRP